MKAGTRFVRPLELVMVSLLGVIIPVGVALAIRGLAPSPQGRGVPGGRVPALIPYAMVAVALLVLMRYQKAEARVRWIVGACLAMGVGASLLIVDRRLIGVLMTDPVVLAMPLAGLTLPLGIGLIKRGVKGVRVGDSLHCASCDYELGTSREEAPRRCPECGAVWLGRWVVGEKRSSPARVWWGVAVLLPFPLLVALSLTPLGTFGLQVLPNRPIIAMAGADAWGHNSGVWSELNTRTLSAEDEARLAETLLDLRKRGGYLYGPPAVWLQKAVIVGGATGPLPQSVMDRYFEEWFEPEIDIPARVEHGSSWPILIEGPQRTGGATMWMYVCGGRCQRGWRAGGYDLLAGARVPRVDVHPVHGSGRWDHGRELLGAAVTAGDGDARRAARSCDVVQVPDAAGPVAARPDHGGE
jgi:predicted RNA-binding Zn-ribbon protein involved in translation (DUF1610 family)